MRFIILLLFRHYLFFFYYFIMSQTIGSRRQVWNGTAKKTSGGLTKTDLMMSHGRIVSKSKHFSAKKEMRLLKHGYGTQKGKFGYVKIGTKKHRKGHKKMKGGHAGINMGLSPSNIAGEGITDFSAAGSIGVQEEAGMAGGSCGSCKMAGGRSRSRGMAGGSGLRSFGEAGSANWSGDGIAGADITVGNAGSANIQLRAGMAGGRGRSRSRGQSRGKGRSMRGGTGSQVNRSALGSSWSAQQMALNAA